jgi:hypothetical protein
MTFNQRLDNLRAIIDSQLEVLDKPRTKNGNSMIRKQIIKKGIPNTRPKKGDIVLVDYTGKLENGTIFDSSLSKGKPFQFKVGAGNIGNYSKCSFTIEGTGSYMGNEESKPTLGEKGELHHEKEVQIGVTFQKHNKDAILKALFKSHPYEEVAYEVTSLENVNQHLGMGMIGILEKPQDDVLFLKFLKNTMKTECILHTKHLNKPIKKVAVLGGSGSFAIEAAKRAGADIFISADLKYHDFFKAENELILADIGHFESEQFTKELLASFLNKKISNFAIVLSQINTNPIIYY